MAQDLAALRAEMARDKTIVTDYIHPHSLNNSAPVDDISPPKVGDDFRVDEAILEALPLPGTKLQAAYRYGSSLWGITAKLITQLADGAMREYFLKIIPNDFPGKHMCEGEYESLKAMHEVVPSFIPKVYGWGRLKNSVGYFLLAEFREIGRQPPDPPRLCMRLAELHKNSMSPTGKFGFHVITCHGSLPQYVEWESSWTVMFSKVLARAMDLDEEKHGHWPEFREPFAFDAGSLYAHNEYEIGYWRPPRHRLSSGEYVREYKKHFPVSKPEEDWDDRNLLYSMRFNISCSVLVPSSGQRSIVFDDMQILCKKFCPEAFEAAQAQFIDPGASTMSVAPGPNRITEEER